MKKKQSAENKMTDRDGQHDEEATAYFGSVSGSCSLKGSQKWSARLAKSPTFFFSSFALIQSLKKRHSSPNMLLRTRSRGCQAVSSAFKPPGSLHLVWHGLPNVCVGISPHEQCDWETFFRYMAVCLSIPLPCPTNSRHRLSHCTFSKHVH